jgi:hypothetical protein
MRAQAADAAARQAEAAQRRAAERQANIERRKARIGLDLTRVIKAKLPLAQAEPLIFNLNARLKPERLDWDFGDAPLRDIFLRICRNLGIPEEWSRHWDDEPDPEDARRADAPAPIHAARPANDAGPHGTAGPGDAEASPQRRHEAMPPPGTVPDGRLTAASPVSRLLAPGTGPP